MVDVPVYLDNHATTRVDPRVVEAMLPYFLEHFGNAHSTGHNYGREAKEAVEQARETLAAGIGARSQDLIFTSGATESNNLAIRGLAQHPKRRGNHIVSVCTEHKAVLDPLSQLAKVGFDVTLLPVAQHPSTTAGLVDLQQLRDSLRDDTFLVSVMLANNEIGVIQPIAEIGEICRERGIALHCDATQGVGKLPVDVETLNVDLMSFTAHKMYGPKGVGALYVRRRPPQVRLASQIDGGGQEYGLRSGTLNVPGVMGFAKALELCLAEMSAERERLAQLRARLWGLLVRDVEGIELNGPGFEHRLPGNLNCNFADVDGEALLLSLPEIAVSSGAACTSNRPEPSHVLRAIGLSEDRTRASLRFGIGRFNTEEQIGFAAGQVAQAVRKLRSFAS